MRWMAAIACLLISSTAAAEPGTLVPGGDFRARATIDSRARLGSELRIGLGDVAEFGVGTVDLDGVAGAHVRSATAPMESEAEPALLLLASFRIGVREDRLFPGQPGAVLGFEKSFEHERDGVSTRVAMLQLGMSHTMGALVLRTGAMMWDASIEREGEAPFLLHDRGMRAQVRPFAAADVGVTPRVRATATIAWKPVVAGGAVALEPVMTGEIRYGLWTDLSVSAGVQLARDDVRAFVGLACRWHPTLFATRSLAAGR
jgi:hypothetical protein